MAVSPPTSALSPAATTRAESPRAADNDEKGTRDDDGNADDRDPSVSNEYVLNVAFLSFLLFTLVQFFFAFVAKSQSMMADCAAMSVDVVSYFVNFLAERLKHGSSTMTPQQLRLKRLYLELVPPLISVATLVVVTIYALQLAIETLIDAYRGKSGSATSMPDVGLMLLFSALNLLLDFVNVTCFARADQAVGLPGQHGNEDVHVHFEHDHHHHSSSHDSTQQQQMPVVAMETTPLVGSTNNNNNNNSDENSCSSAPSSEVETKGLNLNMCSAWTHVCADTLRSVAVLIAAGFSYLFPELLTPVEADSWGAVVVSIIILASLQPLLQGLYLTAVKIRTVWVENRQATGSEHGLTKRIVLDV